MINFFIRCFILISLGGFPQANSKEYTVGVELLDYRPIWFVDSDRFSGFAREVLDAFAREYHHKFIYRPLPVKRLWSEFLLGQLDFKYPDSQSWGPSEKGKQHIYYSKPTLSFKDGVMVKPENFGKTHTLSRLGIIRGFTPDGYQERIQKGEIELFELTKPKQLFDLMKMNRLDGIYINTIVANFFMLTKKYPHHMVAFDPSLPHTKGSYRLSSIKHPELIEEFNQFMENNKQELNYIKSLYGISAE